MKRNLNALVLNCLSILLLASLVYQANAQYTLSEGKTANIIASGAWTKITTKLIPDRDKSGLVLCFAGLTSTNNIQFRSAPINPDGSLGTVASTIIDTPATDIAMLDSPTGTCVLSFLGNSRTEFAFGPSGINSNYTLVPLLNTVAKLLVINAKTSEVVPFALLIDDSNLLLVPDISLEVPNIRSVCGYLADKDSVFFAFSANEGDQKIEYRYSNQYTSQSASIGSNPGCAAFNSNTHILCAEGANSTVISRIWCNTPKVIENNILESTNGSKKFSLPTVSIVEDNISSIVTRTFNVQEATNSFHIHLVDPNLQVLASYASTARPFLQLDHHSLNGMIAVVWSDDLTTKVEFFSVASTTPTAFVPNAASPAVDIGPVAETDQARILGPSISIPIAVVAVAIFLLIFFLRKRKKNQNEKNAVNLTTVNPTNNSTNRSDTGTYSETPVPFMNDQKYKSISVPDDGINPTAIKPSEIDQRMHIPYKNLKFKQEIGAGSYGKVFIGEWRGAEVAIKVNNTITDIEGFLAEAKLTLGIAPHPNLVQTFGVSLDGPNPCIVLEFCGGGSLDNLIFDSDKPITDQQQRDFALKIAYGLLHLHNNNIVHRDLAARNILLTNDGQPKISDFGMSRIVQDESSKGKTKTSFGPIRWMAPESLKDRSYSVKSDVWSYGILLYELTAGMEPHVQEDQLSVAMKIRDQNYTPSIPDNCDPVLKNVMEMCWRANPTDRPTVEEIVQFIRSGK